MQKPDNQIEKKQRIKELRKTLKISQSDFAQILGLEQGNLSKIESSTQTRYVPDDAIYILKERFNVNPIWFESGNGQMFLNVHTGKVNNEENERTYPITESNSTGKMVPFYEADAIAGNEYNMEMSPTVQSGMINIGTLLKDSENAIRVYGNSMVPNYPAGCVIGVKLHTDSFIEPGRVYVLETRDNRYLKRLYYNEDRTAFHCLSDNLMKYEEGPRRGKYIYQDFEIPLNEVIRLHRVIGVIKRNSM